MIKTPSWAYVVGIAMLFFGGCGGIKNCQMIMTPALMDTQKKMMEGMSESEITIQSDTTVTTSSDDSSTTVTVNKTYHQPVWDKKTKKSMEQLFTMTEFQRIWIVRLGYIGFIPTLIYILGGLFLLIRRKFSINLALGALILSIIFTILRLIIISHDSIFSYATIGTSFGSIFGIIVDIILLIIVAVSDKQAYKWDEQGNNVLPPNVWPS